MAVGAVILFLPAVLLLAWGALTIRDALTRRRRGSSRTAAFVLMIVAGAGTIGLAVVAVSPVWADVQYGVVVLPIAALVVAAVWNGALLGSAALADRWSGQPRTRLR